MKIIPNYSKNYHCYCAVEYFGVDRFLWVFVVLGYILGPSPPGNRSLGGTKKWNGWNEHIKQQRPKPNISNSNRKENFSSLITR